MGVVTVNERFALFFPEKRPFFLEGIELFATPNQLVYTRQIVDPIVGGKLAAKLGRWNLAHLTARGPGGAESDALFNVSRLRADYGANSTAGFVLTDRDQGPRRNTVLAADTRLVFGTVLRPGAARRLAHGRRRRRAHRAAVAPGVRPHRPRLRLQLPGHRHRHRTSRATRASCRARTS